MTWIDDITTARDNAAANLKDILASPRPSYTVGEKTFEFNEYLAVLRETIASLTTMIDDQAETPFEISSEGVP
jgi:hypothetical protein